MAKTISLKCVFKDLIAKESTLVQVMLDVVRKPRARFTTPRFQDDDLKTLIANEFVDHLSLSAQRCNGYNHFTTRNFYDDDLDW